VIVFILFLRNLPPRGSCSNRLGPKLKRALQSKGHDLVEREIERVGWRLFRLTATEIKDKWDSMMPVIKTEFIWFEWTIVPDGAVYQQHNPATVHKGATRIPREATEAAEQRLAFEVAFRVSLSHV
jgi:hypothetical protein